MTRPVTPLLTVDIIVTKGYSDELPEILLIKRKNEPFGWALPGGFVEVGETTRIAACRELMEETNLHREQNEMSFIAVADSPDRDPRGHTVSAVYETYGDEKPIAGDDAAEVEYFLITRLPDQIAFDHREVIEEWFMSSVNIMKKK